jgi:hypothetical protein
MNFNHGWTRMDTDGNLLPVHCVATDVSLLQIKSLEKVLLVGLAEAHPCESVFIRGFFSYLQ